MTAVAIVLAAAAFALIGASVYMQATGKLADLVGQVLDSLRPEHDS